MLDGCHGAYSAVNPDGLFLLSFLARSVSVSSSPSSRINDLTPLSSGGMRCIVGFSDWGEMVVETLVTLGDMAIFSAKVMIWLFSAWPRKGTILPKFLSCGRA